MTFHQRTRTAKDMAAVLADVGRDWRKVGGPICNGNPGGPDWIVRVISTERLYRIGDFTYQRLLKHRAEPTPEGWLEISEDGDPIEYTEDDRACSQADRLIRERKEQG